MTKQQLLLRYHFNINTLLGPLARALRWAEGAKLKAELDKQWTQLLGPRSALDDEPLERKRKPALIKVCKDQDRCASQVLCRLSWCPVIGPSLGPSGNSLLPLGLPRHRHLGKLRPQVLGVPRASKSTTGGSQHICLMNSVKSYKASPL